MLKKKQAPSGAPEWVLTYGDMMSLLLCFFILLVAFADFEEGAGQPKIAAVLESIREAFGGMPGQSGAMLDPQIDFHSMIKRLESIIKPEDPKNRGNSEEKGIQGKSVRLRRIRQGAEITIGGPIIFKPFEASITEEGKEVLGQIADILRGHRNKIEIRGHAAEEPRPADWTDGDAMDLSYRRARFVAEELERSGVESRRVVLVAAGRNEPVTQGVYDPAKLADNRRVEIIVRESLIDDYMEPSPPDAADTETSTTAPDGETEGV
ncbi:MAG: OmpA family protein [Phycisphaerales bacterium]|nr:OmpA family protein [Phycisphaerales bacterium]